MKVAFDLDGVVYDLIGPLDRYMIRNGFELVDESSYAMGKRYGIPEKDGMMRLDSFGLKRPFKTMPLFEQAKKEMESLKGCELYIVTHRAWTPHGVEDTLERIITDDLPIKHENIIFSRNKGKWAKKLGIDLFYEDSLDNAIDILENSTSEVKLIDAPYNQTDDARIKRIKW